MSKTTTRIIKAIKLSELTANKLNPRRDLGLDSLFVNSILENGIKEPIMVFESTLQIVKGHRRTAGAEMAGLETIECIMVDDSKMSDQEKVDYLLDHAGEKSLSKAEAFLSAQIYFNMGLEKKQVHAKISAVLDTAFGEPTQERIDKVFNRDLEKARKSIADYQATQEFIDLARVQAGYENHNGTLQVMKNLADLPSAITECYLDVWDKKHKKITQKDVKQLHILWDKLANGTKAKDGSVLTEGDRVANPRGGEMSAEMAEAFDVVLTVNAEKGVKTGYEKHMSTREDCEKQIGLLLSEEAILTLKWVTGIITLEEYRSQVN